MTKPKLPPHRLGFDSPDVQDRALDDVREYAQHIWLQAVARVKPEVLATLAAVTADAVRGVELDVPNEAMLKTWAAGWHLSADWCIAIARATWSMWRQHPGMKRDYWCPRDDLAGGLYRPRPGRQAARPLRTPEHFEWLARYQFGEPYQTIATDARNVCVSLAKQLDLPLRPAERGWTRRNKTRQTSSTQ